MHRRLTSNYLYSRNTGLLRQAIIEIEDGEVKNIIDTEGDFKELPALEFHSGIFIIGEISKLKFDSLKQISFPLNELYTIFAPSSTSMYLLTKVDYINNKLTEKSLLKRFL